MLYFSVNKNNINDNNYWMKIVHNMQQCLINEQSLDNKILVIRLQDITNDDNTMIPKLEHKKM